MFGIESGNAMGLVAIAAVVAALYLYWRCKKTDCVIEYHKYKTHAMIAAAIAAVAAFLYYRRSQMVESVASQYLISPNEF